MVVDRSDREHQPVGDLGVGEALGEQVEHVRLAGGQAGRVGARRGLRAAVSGDALLAPVLLRRLLDDFVSRAGAPAAPAPGLAELTPREEEVLRLVARGLSNAEIADRLVLGEGTVKTHVSHVLGKLGLRDRVQAVVYAYESGLVSAGRRP